jgi:membrane fusion protein (multidrug efflux system)
MRIKKSVIFLFPFLAIWCKNICAAEMPPMPVKATIVTVQSVDKHVRAQGEIKAFRRVTLQSDIAGKVIGLNLPEGQAVKAGDIVIQLDDSIYKARLKQAKSKLDHSQNKYNRVKKLLEKGTGSTSEAEEAAADLKFNEADMELAKINVDKTQITAPFSGILGLKDVDVGDYINPGQPLIYLVDINTIMVDFHLPEKYLLDIKEGMKVNLVADSLPGQDFNGKIYAIAPTLDATMRSLHVRAKFENPKLLLKPGLFSRLRIILETMANALIIPEEALMYQESKFYVYKIVDNKVIYTEVLIGTKENGSVQVTSGLEENDQIVLAGQIKLYDGAAVNVVE